VSSHRLEDLGPFPERPLREDLLNQCLREADDLFSNLTDKYKLTSSELMFVLTRILYSWANRFVAIERRQVETSSDKDSS
jgi:hypothetical protein